MKPWPSHRWPFRGPDPMIGPRRMLVHARQAEYETAARGDNPFLRSLATVMERHAIPSHVLRARTRWLDAIPRARQHLHVIAGPRSCRGAHVFHVSPSYLRGFWHFDEFGVLANSSMRLRRYRAEAIDAGRARRFQRQLYRRIVSKERTKHAQPDAGATLPADAIAIFAQDFSELVPPVLYLGLRELIEAVIAARGARPVLIKPHPMQGADTLAMIRAFHAPASGIHVTRAHVFDVLRAAAVTVSQCSAASFEGFLLDRPAILAGRTDFHHVAMTVRSRGDVAAALGAVTSRQVDHARYLWWYLAEHCFDIRDAQLARRLEAQLVENGFLAAPR